MVEAISARAIGLLASEPLSFKTNLLSPRRASIELDDHCVPIEVVGPQGAASALLSDLRPLLYDAIACKVRLRDRSELMLVHPATASSVWVCVVSGDGRSLRARATRVERQQIDVTFALPHIADQAGELRALHRQCLQLLAPVLSLEPAGATRRLLRIKVDRSQLWFLRYPFGGFARLSLSGFGRYSACQYIVTDRSISNVAQTQIAVESEIADTAAFLAGTRLIINTYRAHREQSDAAQLAAGYRLIFDTLAALRHVPLGEDVHCLKWVLNPSIDEFNAILLSPETRFLLANFEADNSKWMLGDEEHGCSDGCGGVAGRGELVDPAIYRDRLGHIRMMRVFHCNSLFNPYEQQFDPGDDSTLAARILSTGAFFVDASVTKERAVDFVCSLLGLLLGRADLRAILNTMSMTGQFDSSHVIAEANGLLATRGFSSLPELDVD